MLEVSLWNIHMINTKDAIADTTTKNMSIIVPMKHVAVDMTTSMTMSIITTTMKHAAAVIITSTIMNTMYIQKQRKQKINLPT